jgi:hypothetical protein
MILGLARLLGQSHNYLPNGPLVFSTTVLTATIRSQPLREAEVAAEFGLTTIPLHVPHAPRELLPAFRTLVPVEQFVDACTDQDARHRIDWYGQISFAFE